MLLGFALWRQHSETVQLRLRPLPVISAALQSRGSSVD
jgi:hypothetical protein